MQELLHLANEKATLSTFGAKEEVLTDMLTIFKKRLSESPSSRSLIGYFSASRWRDLIQEDIREKNPDFVLSALPLLKEYFDPEVYGQWSQFCLYGEWEEAWCPLRSYQAGTYGMQSQSEWLFRGQWTQTAF